MVLTVVVAGLGFGIAGTRSFTKEGPSFQSACITCSSAFVNRSMAQV